MGMMEGGSYLNTKILGINYLSYYYYYYYYYSYSHLSALFGRVAAGPEGRPGKPP